MGLVNIQNTNFENGITNRNAADLFGSMAQLDPTRFHTYMEDFNYYTAADWNITGVNAGTPALTDGEGGVLINTNGGLDNDSTFFNKVGEGFQFNASQDNKLYFRARWSINQAVESDFIIGIGDAAGLSPANGAFFRTDDGDAELDFFVKEADNDEFTATNISDVIADGVFLTTEFYFDGIDRIYYGVNGTPLGFGEIDPLPGGLLAPLFSAQNGQASGLITQVDYFFVAQQRD